jgi:hypothetical protein
MFLEEQSFETHCWGGIIPDQDCKDSAASTNSSVECKAFSSESFAAVDLGSEIMCDVNIVSTPRTFCRSNIPSIMGTEIAKKILELRGLLTEGADSRPLEVLDELCRFANFRHLG